MRLSIIIPTLGRKTLAATLHSIAPQLGDHDEVLLVADTTGDIDHSRRLVTDQFGPFSDCRWRYAEIESDGTGPGYAQREYGMLLAKGTHLAFMDDDDRYLHGALDVIKTNAERLLPTVFRIRHPLLGIIWADPQLVYGNVSSQMIVVPNLPGKLGEWAPHQDGRGGDFTFLRGCVERMGDPKWRPRLVAELSPAGAQPGSHVLGALTV